MFQIIDFHPYRVINQLSSFLDYFDISVLYIGKGFVKLTVKMRYLCILILN